MPRGKPDIQNYSPQLFELIAKASQERVTLRFAEMKHARRMRFRIYALRSTMKEEGHPLAGPAAQLTTKLYTDGDQACLDVFPGDDDLLLNAIEQAGITAAPPEIIKGDDDMSLDEFLSREGLVEEEKE